MARRAVELDYHDAEAHAILGVVALFMGQFDDSLRRLQTALEINPNLALAYMWGGGYYALSCQGAQARAHLNEALRLSPRDPGNYWVLLFMAWRTLLMVATRRPLNARARRSISTIDFRPPIGCSRQVARCSVKPRKRDRPWRRY